MNSDVVARDGESVVAVRTEGDNEGAVYITEFPNLESEFDVIIARTTQLCWFEDLNMLISFLDVNDIDYLMTRDGFTIDLTGPTRFPLCQGISLTRDNPGDAMRMFASYLAEEAGVSKCADVEDMLTRSPMEFFEQVLRSANKGIVSHV